MQCLIKSKYQLINNPAGNTKNIYIFFNFSRRLQSRKSCIDLQTLVIHIPKSKSEQITAQNKQIMEKTNYPISLVPGQFSEFFKSYSAEELALVFLRKLRFLLSLM